MTYAWLSALLDEPCDETERYELFRADYIDNPPAILAPREFRVDDRRVTDGREEAFHHLTKSGKPRSHDPYRCRRMHWGKPIVERFDRDEIVTWRRRQYGENRIKLALRDYSFLVVVAVDKTSVRLVTAFFPHGEREREKIRQESRQWDPDYSGPR
jgi:hypothetical protein